MSLGFFHRWTSVATQFGSRIGAGPPVLWSADDVGLYVLAGTLLWALLVTATLAVGRCFR